MPPVPLDQLLARPGWHLHRIDPVRQRASFVATSAQRIRDTIFLDGRTVFWSGGEIEVGLDELLAAARDLARPAERLIFHMSFCGSTHLSHLIEEAAGALVVKEPQALVDLADWHSAPSAGKSSDPRFEALLGAALALLSRPWERGAPVVVKPSNWADNLLPVLPGEGWGRRRLLFVSIARRPFLRAVFRGGRERMAFTARVASHLAAADPGAGVLIEAAVVADSEPLARIARLALVAHHLQERRYAEARAGTGGPRMQRIDFALLSGDPVAALREAAAALDLATDERALARAVGQRRDRDAKRPGEVFSSADRAGQDRLVEQHHGGLFDRALAWAQTALPA